ncbi:carbohydrate ABC transporter permease [Thermus tengchongensis]|uniref:Carbohydrate ABC transporter permease n=1 Tax=Thermus tengchongensis TaxID=1214928 RepID=A0A4Y9F7M8_9DEIN|nr:carbohydrate ABC transporter permease [Thermus tengchongensis]TFU25147.1 carbohydrate ABC transporter permease [Thermus tengchongensis]
MRRREALYQVLLVAFLGGLSVFVLYPFLWMVLTGFKPPAEAYTWPPKLLPGRWTLEHYRALWEALPVGRALWNSLWTSAFLATSNLVLASLAAYAFTRLRFLGRETLFGLHVLSMLLPWQITLIPTFLLVRSLGLVDTFLGLLLPSLTSGYAVYVLGQYLKTFPKSLEESVLVDGGTPLTALLRVVLPLSRGALAVLWVLLFLGYWQSFIWPSVVLSSPEKMVLPVALLAIQNYHAVNIPLLMAGTTLMALPPVLVYLFFQRALQNPELFSGFKG